MKTVKNVFNIAFYNIRKWRKNYRVWIVALYLAIFTYYFTANIAGACERMGTPISQWIFPFIFRSDNALMYLTIPIVLLFCDAPFLDSTQPYIIARSRRNVWCVGQIMYIVIASFLYALYMLVISIVVHLPHMQFSSGWGAFLENPLAQDILHEGAGTPGFNPQYFLIDEYVLTNYTPMQAMKTSFVMLWLTGILIGLVIFCMNSITSSRVVGVVCGMALIISAFEFAYTYELLEYLPVAWVSVANINIKGAYAFHHLMYMRDIKSTYATAFIILIGAIMIHNRRRSIEVLPPV